MMKAFCLHGEETLVLGDCDCRKSNRAFGSFDKEGNLTVPTPTSKPAGGVLSNEQKALKRLLSAIRAVVKHLFRVLKRKFGYAKVHYRGPVKKTGQFVTMFVLINLWLARNL